jgi:hypothetical protein
MNLTIATTVFAVGKWAAYDLSQIFKKGN